MSNKMAGQTLDSGQLDLFVHSRAVILANDAMNALLAREAAQAEAFLRRLGAEAPDYGALNALPLRAVRRHRLFGPGLSIEAATR